jgi:hypothetical protein
MTTLVITAAAFELIFNLWIQPSFECSTESDLPQGNVRSSFVFTRGDDVSWRRPWSSLVATM